MTRLKKTVVLLLSLGLLQACERVRNINLENIRFNPPGTMFDFPRNRREPVRVVQVVRPSANIAVANATVLAPERFNAEGRGLWDGRPSFGGVWVASPDAVDPERVLITNKENGRQILGALFKREIFLDGPPIQLSSEAASALGVEAGRAVNLSVVAVQSQQAQ